MVDRKNRFDGIHTHTLHPHLVQESPLSEGVDCCAAPEAEDCDPILVDEDDPLHAKLPCINYRRSAKAQAILGNGNLNIIFIYYLPPLKLCKKKSSSHVMNLVIFRIFLFCFYLYFS